MYKFARYKTTDILTLKAMFKVTTPEGVYNPTVYNFAYIQSKLKNLKKKWEKVRKVGKSEKSW